MKIFDNKGNRLFLSTKERNLFEKQAISQKDNIKALSLILLYTGARISEVLDLEYKDIDSNSNTIKFISQNNGDLLTREIPVPDKVIQAINTTKKQNHSSPHAKIFLITRMTAYRQVKMIMNKANIKGPMASPKGLRHSFGIFTISNCSIPIHIVSEWMGHKSLQTTSVYLIKNYKKSKRNCIDIK